MSGRNEKKAAKLRAKAEAAQIESDRLLQKAVDELKDERDKRLRRETGQPLSYKHAEEERAEKERKERKSKTALGRFKSMFTRKSRSPSPPPPPAYDELPPTYEGRRNPSRGGKRSKKRSSKKRSSKRSSKKQSSKRSSKKRKSIKRRK